LNGPAIARIPKAGLIAVPLLIATVDASVVVYRRTRPDTDKAIRLVQGSSSRIENFTVKQYIYATLFDNMGKDSNITIDGWRAERQTGRERSVRVQFRFTKDGIAREATWEVDLSEDKVIPTNEDAWNLSWNSFQF
jgi:hypothetical protein